MMRFTSASSRFGIPPIAGVFAPIESASGLLSSFLTSLRFRKTDVPDGRSVGPRRQEDRDGVEPSTYLNV